MLLCLMNKMPANTGNVNNIYFSSIRLIRCFANSNAKFFR